MIGFNRVLRRLPGNRFNQRWGAWTSMTLRNSTGDIYLFRRRIVQTPLFAVYLHDIEAGDEASELHNHPFPFASLILRGGYTEARAVLLPAQTMDGVEVPDWRGSVEHRTLKRGRWNVMPRHTRVHTILHALPGTRTLVFAGPRKNSWGWYVEGRGIVHWSDFLLEQNREPLGVRLAQINEESA